VIPRGHPPPAGIEPGTKLDFELEGDTIRVRPLRAIRRTRPEDGYGMLKCDHPGERRPATSLSQAPCAAAAMIALDTEILALFYVDDFGDAQAAEQRPVGYAVIAESPSLFVPTAPTPVAGLRS
jgi:hypothetical protein